MAANNTSLFDKGLYQTPKGLEVDPLAEDTTPIDVVEDDGEGGVIVTLGEESEEKTESFNSNLAEFMDDEDLNSMASDLMAEVEEDDRARKEWLDLYTAGLDLLGLKYEERTQPWPGACGVTHPLLMEAAVKFQAETIMETFPAQGPVRAKILGRETQEKKDAAHRVEEDLNYRLTETMEEYRPEHERLLITLPLSGNAFKKVYKDPDLGRETAIYVAAEDVIVPYGATSLAHAERITHRMRKTKQEVKRLQAAGFYSEVDLGDPQTVMDETDRAKAKAQNLPEHSHPVDKRYQVYEVQCLLDLKGYEDDNGIAYPYVVTIEKSTNKVLAIYRNWVEGDKRKKKRRHFVHYGYVPGFGFYHFGLIHLIGGHTKAATSLLRQLIDSGTLSNIPGGFKAKGMRVKNDNQPIGPGEWVDVDLPSGTIKDNILALPYKEPSPTLVALMDKVVEDARRYASVADLKVSDLSAQAPVGTTLAVLERMLKVLSAVQARIHYSMKQEFKLLKAIIRDNAPTEKKEPTEEEIQAYDYDPDIGERTALQSDYATTDVVPVSDPNAATMSQRVVQYQAVHQLASSAPQLYDMPFLHRQMIEVLGVKNANKIVPSSEDLKPIDPVSENMAIFNGKPVKAFAYQDHASHIAVHQAAMQDPKMAQLMGQNPAAQSMQAAAMAHIMEHVAFQYRIEIEQQLGASLPPIPEQAHGEVEAENILPPLEEVKLSKLVAAAAQKLLGKNTVEAQAQAAQAAANDPVMQLQQKDLEIKEKETARKQQKDIMDAAAKADQQRLAERKTGMQGRLDAIKILIDAASQVDSNVQGDETEAVNILTEIMKHADTSQQKAQQAAQAPSGSPSASPTEPPPAAPSPGGEA